MADAHRRRVAAGWLAMAVGAAAVAERSLDRARLGVVRVAVLVNVRDEKAGFLHPLHDQFARAIDTVALEAVEAEIFGRDNPVARLDDVRVAVEHVEHLGGLEPRALADVEVVEIMPRRACVFPQRAIDEKGL